MVEIQDNKEIPNVSEKDAHIKDLFQRSFRFSQGEQNLQTRIFSWLTVHGHVTEANVPIRPPDYVLDLTPPPMHIGFTEEELISFNDPNQDPKRAAWSELAATVRALNVSDPEPDRWTRYILQNVIERDIKYQKESRPGRTGNIPDSSNDPHASYLRRFALKGASTGTEAFDALHKELDDLTRKYKGEMGEHFTPFTGQTLTTKQQTMNLLAKLEQLWEVNHNKGGQNAERFFVSKPNNRGSNNTRMKKSIS